MGGYFREGLSLEGLIIGILRYVFYSLFVFFTESEQITGSFKLRGAFNKLLYLKESNDEVFLTKGVITSSTGNHGAATVSVNYILIEGAPVLVT